MIHKNSTMTARERLSFSSEIQNLKFMYDFIIFTVKVKYHQRQ